MNYRAKYSKYLDNILGWMFVLVVVRPTTF